MSPGPLPARVEGPVKERLLKLVDDAVEAGWPHLRACQVLEVSDERVHRWGSRLRELGTLVDRAPGGNPVHRLLAWEEAEILDLLERVGAGGPLPPQARAPTEPGWYRIKKSTSYEAADPEPDHQLEGGARFHVASPTAQTPRPVPEPEPFSMYVQSGVEAAHIDGRWWEVIERSTATANRACHPPDGQIPTWPAS